MSLEADTDSKLIELVEQFPGLYDKSSADHKNPETISTMWEIISRKLKLPRYECEGRWKYLRKRFTQTNTTWKHHNSLTFLEPFIKRRKLLSNNLSDIKDDEVMIIEECEDKKFYIPLQCEKKRKMIDREDEATFVQSFREKNPEEDSVRSFCNSISSDLLKLSSHEMLNCRIDILTVIQKYMLRMNDDSSGDTLVPELMKHFAEIENKIMQQKMTAHDKDWVILYTIKNLFSKMMDLQKHNADLHELLRNFQSVEQMKKKTGSVRKETNELRSAFVEQTSNRASVRKETNELRSAFVEQTSNRASVQNGNSFLPAALVEPANTKNGSVPSEKNFLPSAQCSANNSHFQSTEEEVSSSEKKPAFTESVYFEEIKLKEMIPFEVATLKENILLDGIVNNSFCNICNMENINADLHKKSITHVISRKNYYLSSCIRNLNPLVYSIKNEKLKCTFCFQNIYSLWYLDKHVTNYKHRKNTESVVDNTDYRNYIKKGILEVGPSLRFCLLCQENTFGIPHHNGGLHKRKVMEIETCCKVKNDMYCFICKKLFSAVNYENHRNDQEHRVKFKNYYFKNRNLYDC